MVSGKNIYITKTAAQTKKLGNLLAKSICNEPVGGQALVLLLRGDLGAGKTNFVQGLARGLGIKDTVNSPTFVIFKIYPLKKNRAGFKNFYHVDCYRLGESAALKGIGIEKIMADPKNLVAIEWPKVSQKLLGGNFIRLAFEVLGKNERRITVD
jgi:tRNA threonylcarbamoyladenosine biosynthesis protein TsaE